MMKLKSLFFAMVFVMAMALTGCSASREDNGTASAAPTNSAGVNDGAYYSDNVGAGQNDGHVSDDYYQNNVSGNGGNPANRGNSSNGENVMDDIGDAAGDLARGAGNVVRDAGDAIGDAAGNVGRAMR